MKTTFKAPLKKTGSFKFLVVDYANKTMFEGNSGATSYSHRNAQILATVKNETELNFVTEQFLMEGFKFVPSEEF